MRRRMTIMAIAMATGMAGLTVPGTATAGVAAGWKPVFQAHVSGFFQDITAISRTNVWAVADLLDGNRIVHVPYIRHFDGHGWKPITIPGAKMTSDVVQATSPDDVWIFGLTQNRQGIAASGAYRWNGKHWQKIPVPRYTDLQGVVVLSPSNVWAFGSSGTVTGDVFHWNGRQWTPYYVNIFPQSMSGSSARNIWLTGETRPGDKEVASAFRWNGSHWRPVPTPHPVVDVGPSVTVLSRSNVWIGWDTVRSAKAAHWDGRRWRQITAPGTVQADSFEIVPDGRHGYWFGPFADWTGKAWLSAGISPENPGGDFSNIAQIPRTHSFLMAAGVFTKGSTTQHPTIYRLNLR